MFLIAFGQYQPFAFGILALQTGFFQCYKCQCCKRVLQNYKPRNLYSKIFPFSEEYFPMIILFYDYDYRKRTNIKLYMKQFNLDFLDKKFMGRFMLGNN